MGWVPLPFFKACNPKPMALVQGMYGPSQGMYGPSQGFLFCCGSLSFFWLLPAPHNLSPGRVFIFLFFATLGVEWLWQRPLRCCFATSFGFGPCPFGFVWPLWPPTIRALSSIFSFTAAAAVAGGAGLALLCACQIMVVKKGYGIS